MFPPDVFADKTKRDKIVPLLTRCKQTDSTCTVGSYIMSGIIPKASDGMDSFPIRHRQGGVLIYVPDPGFHKAFTKIFYEVEEEDEAEEEEEE